MFVTSIPVSLYIMIRFSAKIDPRWPNRGATTYSEVYCLDSRNLSPCYGYYPGLDHRFGWSGVPLWLSIAGNFLIVLSMWLVYRVFKVNSFGSTTVEVTNKQKVISTGPYAIVRNPMYSCAIVFFVGMSLALGSYWGLIPRAPYIAWFCRTVI